MNIKSTIKDAKTSANDVLFYMVLDSRISNESKKIYKKELIERGLGYELNKRIRKIEHKKKQLIKAVGKLSKDELFAIVVYNTPFHFEEKELTIFKNEIKNRGFSKELADAIQKENEKSNKFKSLSENLNNVEDLLNVFNKNTLSDSKKSIKKGSILRIIIGTVLILIGIFLTINMGGKNIYYGAILAGVLIVIKELGKIK